MDFFTIPFPERPTGAEAAALRPHVEAFARQLLRGLRIEVGAGPWELYRVVGSFALLAYRLWPPYGESAPEAVREFLRRHGHAADTPFQEARLRREGDTADYPTWLDFLMPALDESVAAYEGVVDRAEGGRYPDAEAYVRDSRVRLELEAAAQALAATPPGEALRARLEPLDRRLRAALAGTGYLDAAPDEWAVPPEVAWWWHGLPRGADPEDPRPQA